MSKFQLCLPSTKTSVSLVGRNAIHSGFFSCPLGILTVGLYVFNMCTFNLQCTLYEYMDSFVRVSSCTIPYLFIFSAFVRKWWRAIVIAIGVFLYLLYLAIFIALAVIFAPQNGKSKDRVTD